MIRGTVGRGGSGKSSSTVTRLHKRFVGGRAVASNTPLIDLRVKQVPTPKGMMWVPVDTVMFGESWASVYVTAFRDIYDLDNCDCLLDELGAWMPAHKHAKMPDEVRRFLAQDRREGVDVWWTHRTTRVFHEVLDNTAELTRCSRYGPLIIASTCDPEMKDEKGTRRFYPVSPLTYDLYDTFARVGSADGDGSAQDRGYGVGKRQAYKSSGDQSAFYYDRMLPTVSGEPLRAYIRLRPEQAACMIRKFGPLSVGVQREERMVTGRHEPWRVRYASGCPPEIVSPDWSGLTAKGFV